jgi:hypothetical protein
MLYAVAIEPLNAVFFLGERPAGADWNVRDGVWLDVPANYDAWPEGAECPEQVLCVLNSDPKHYKIFKYYKDVNEEEFRPTGRRFGGVYSRSTWERFVKTLPATLEFLRIPDGEPQDAAHDTVNGVKHQE